MSTSLLRESIETEARRLGFDYVRFAPIGRAPHVEFFATWLALGRAGEMAYLTRHLDERGEPALLLDDDAAQTMVVLGVNYHQFDLPSALRDDPSRGIIASYAWGDDYHEILRGQLYQLDAFLAELTGRTTRAKALVDTGPVLERDWAERAGLGFFGKNCCIIHPVSGSWLFLATLIIPEVVPYDAGILSAASLSAQRVALGLPPAGNYGNWELSLEADGPQSDAVRAGTCGRCTRCLDSCPTRAFIGPFHLDPLRCISYWTIEARQPIPRALRAHFGNRIFGCDICQEVCPWNSRLPERTPKLSALAAQVDRIAPPLLEGFAPDNPYWLDDDAFRTRFRRSPVKRPGRAGMLRNVCVALGNWGAPATVDALRLALADPHPLPRGHAAWALGQVLRRHDIRAAKVALHDARRTEADPWVLSEIEAAR